MTIQIAREETCPPHGLLFLISSKGSFYASSHREDNIYTTAFVTPVVEHWLEQMLGRMPSIRMDFYLDISDILQTPSYFVLPPLCIKSPKIICIHIYCPIWRITQALKQIKDFILHSISCLQALQNISSNIP